MDGGNMPLMRCDEIDEAGMNPYDDCYTFRFEGSFLANTKGFYELSLNDCILTFQLMSSESWSQMAYNSCSILPCSKPFGLTLSWRCRWKAIR